MADGNLQYLNLTATEQLQALRRGEISAVELLEQTIDRAEKLAPSLNPFALTLYGRARQAAQEADKKIAAGTGGKLCGLPLTISSVPLVLKSIRTNSLLRYRISAWLRDTRG